jgi:hypothetical protein
MNKRGHHLTSGNIRTCFFIVTTSCQRCQFRADEIKVPLFCSSNNHLPSIFTNVIKYYSHRESSNRSAIRQRLTVLIAVLYNRLVISTRWRFLFYPFSSRPSRLHWVNFLKHRVNHFPIFLSIFNVMLDGVYF